MGIRAAANSVAIPAPQFRDPSNEENDKLPRHNGIFKFFWWVALVDKDRLYGEPPRTTSFPHHENAAAEHHENPEGKNNDRPPIAHAGDLDVACGIFPAG